MSVSLSLTVMSEEDMLQLHSAFTEVFRSITDFLLSLPPPLPTSNPLIIAFVRVLGAWLAEESISLTSELYELLPRLLVMCEALLKEGEEGSQARAGEWALDNPLRFLLPGLSHLMAEERPRACVKTTLPHLLLHYMTALNSSSQTMRYGWWVGGWLSVSVTGLSSSEAVASFTLCVEVLLTVCVCEVALRRSRVFCQIAQLLSTFIASGKCARLA